MNKKTTFIILGIVILVALIAIGIILRKPTTAPIETPITPSEEAAEEPTETPAETPPTAPGLSSCVVLDEEYCDKGEPIYHEGEFSLIGFILPKGVKIYAPAEGLYGKEAGVVPKRSVYTFHHLKMD